MLPSFLTAALFSLSIVSAGRAARTVGVLNANFARLALSLALLGVFAHLWGQGVAGPGLQWFIIGGIIGVGLGDLATFIALGRIGPRLSILVVDCLCAPLGALIEWVWLGTTLDVIQILGGVIILGGVAIVFLPGANRHPPGLALGIGCAVAAAAAQAIGAVLTRKGNEVNLLEGITVSPLTSAYQRMLGAFAILLLIYACWNYLLPRRKDAVQSTEPAAARWKRGSPWIVANALTGLTFGVICFQWALTEAPAGVVLSVLATVPLMVIPLTWVLDGDRPTRAAIIGGAVAVAGVLILLNSRTLGAALGWAI